MGTRPQFSAIFIPIKTRGSSRSSSVSRTYACGDTSNTGRGEYEETAGRTEHAAILRDARLR